METDEAAHDRQAETGAFVRPIVSGFGLKERRAQLRQIARGDTDSRIGYADLDVAALRARADVDGAAIWREFHGVGHEVEEYLLAGAFVGDDLFQLGRIPRVERKLLLPPST